MVALYPKLVSTTLIVLFALAGALPAGNTAWAAERITLFGNTAKPPKTWSEDGAPKGILVDIIKEIQKRSDLDFTIEQRPWARAYEQALQGAGGVYGLSKTQERLELFDYSEPIFIDEILLVTLKGRDFPFESMADLAGKRIGTTRGSVYGDDFKYAMENIFIPIYSNDPVLRLRMLLERRIDAAVIGPGKAGLRFQLERDPYLIGRAEEFVVLEKPIAVDPNYIGFKKTMNQGKTLETINRAVHSMLEDGSLEAISQKYELIPAQ